MSSLSGHMQKHDRSTAFLGGVAQWPPAWARLLNLWASDDVSVPFCPVALLRHLLMSSKKSLLKAKGSDLLLVNLFICKYVTNFPTLHFGKGVLSLCLSKFCRDLELNQQDRAEPYSKSSASRNIETHPLSWTHPCHGLQTPPLSSPSPLPREVTRSFCLVLWGVCFGAYTPECAPKGSC